MAERFQVTVGPETLGFSAAHFITYGGGQAERLHGHNYRVSARVEGELKEAGYVFDFVRLRKEVAALLAPLDHRLLLPEENPRFSIATGEDAVRVRVGGHRYRFPRRDVAFVPVANTTSELLARYLAGLLAERLAAIPKVELHHLRLEVGEAPGHGASYEMELHGP